MMIDKENKEYFIKCDCGAEGLHIEKDELGDVYFGLWYYGRENLGIKDKLRWMWNILKGKPYADTIIISDERISEIMIAISELRKKK